MKIKPLSKEQLIISIDRLTRFKNPETKYLRVFKDIILSNLLEPKFKLSELDDLDYDTIKQYAQKIINFSLNSEGTDLKVNSLIYDYELSVFNVDNNVKKLLKNEIDYNAIIKLLGDDIPLNLKWLKNLSVTISQIEDRKSFGLRFPVEKVVISEGITEEILLPEFSKLAGYDFDKNGIVMISAGGKSQVVKLFYKLSEELKIPVFVLLDRDAQSNYEEIKPRLRAFDNVHVLSCGEFEDLLTISLIKKSLNYMFNNISMFDFDKSDASMVKTLENIFRHRGLHEFKKAEFAHAVKSNINSKEDLSEEIINIVTEIKNLIKI